MNEPALGGRETIQVRWLWYNFRKTPTDSEMIKMDGKRYAVVDLETTGHSPKSGDRIIEIGMALVENGIVTKTYATFLKPGRKIPAFISSLTGIRDKDVADAPLFEDRAAEIREWLEGCVFVAHNV